MMFRWPLIGFVLAVFSVASGRIFASHAPLTVQLLDTFWIHQSTIKRLDKTTRCDGIYTLRRAIEVPPTNGYDIDWSAAKQSPDHDKHIAVFARADTRSWQFSVRRKYQRPENATPVGFGVFCINVHKPD